MPPTNLIVCFDGTANSEYIEKNPLTNVSRIRRAISNKGHDDMTRQIVHYEGGIGTGFGNPLNLWQRAVGYELERIIIRAYTFLCENYDATSRDQIFLIGYSRGAFAVRCLADFVHLHGVLPQGQVDDIHRLYRDWTHSEKHDRKQQQAPSGHPAQITACALWDTVGAVGIPMPRYILGRRLPFIHSDIPGSVQYIFQALALHEHRYHFFPLVLRCPADEPNSDRNLEQCWFAGYHADAGGGNKDDALAHFALVWMMSRLERWIRFDMAKASEHLIPQTTWRVGGPAGARHGANSYLLPVSDSMDFLFMTGGSKYRIPQTEFWTEKGIVERSSDIYRSREKMHPTARYLAQAKLVKECHSAEHLRPAQPQHNGQSWVWSLRCSTESSLWRLRSGLLSRLRSRAESGSNWAPQWLTLPDQDVQGGNQIYEEELNDFERKALHDWTLSDHRELDDQSHPPGAPPPGTILVHLRAWLNNDKGVAKPLRQK